MTRPTQLGMFGLDPVVATETPPPAEPGPSRRVEDTNALLFSGPSLSEPAAPFTSHTTTIHDGTVTVRLRLLAISHSEPIPTGPLTYGECAAWEEPCQLYACRHRLDDAVEARTRRTVQDLEEEAMDGVYYGPRLASGAYYSRTALVPVTIPGHWCALQVAEVHGEMSPKALGELLGMATQDADRLVGKAVEAYAVADSLLDDVAGANYGAEGRHHRYSFPSEAQIERDEIVTSTEAKALRVPGEVPKGRQPLRVRGRSRKDKWAGVTSVVVPEQFLGMVNERFMKPLRANDVIPAAFSDMKKMMANRKKAA